jgi:hypothetical protein
MKLTGKIDSGRSGEGDSDRRDGAGDCEAVCARRDAIVIPVIGAGAEEARPREAAATGDNATGLA